MRQSDQAKELLRDAEISAEKAIALVRCFVGLAASAFYFLIVSPRLETDNPFLGLTFFFVAFTSLSLLAGAAAWKVARAGRYKGWMNWAFTTFDIGLWACLIVAITTTIDLPSSLLVLLPPTLLVFVLLPLVALRNDPFLQAYALAGSLAILIFTYLSLGRFEISGSGAAASDINFFRASFDLVRLAIVALAGLTLIFLARRTRALLNSAIQETVQRSNLSRFLPQQLTQRLGNSDPGDVMAGETIEAAVMFVDIRGFTNLSETMEPKDLGAFLSKFRSIVMKQTDDMGGIVDKFIGDCVMAVFGAPEALEGDAERALACASRIVENVDQWNIERRKLGEPEVSVGVGVHWGVLFCGAIGDRSRLEFTVLGDTVNVASRLEQLTKDAGSPIAVSGQMLRAAGVDFPEKDGWQLIGDMQIRGRKRPMRVFAQAVER